MLQLYTYFRSSASFRVRIALHHKGLAWTPEVIWLLSDEHQSAGYQAVNPQGLVPALVDAGQVLNQSLAIIEYLDETKPGPKLLPAEPLDRARVRSLSMLVAAEIHPLNNPRVMKYLKTEMGQTQDAVDTWYRHWVSEGLAAFERQLQDGRSGRYCHGDTVSMADACLVPQIFNAQRFKTDLSPFPRTLRIFEDCMTLPAFQAAQPSRQADAARASS